MDITVWKKILDGSDFLTQIRLTQVAKYLHDNLRITDFYNIGEKYRKLLNDNILKGYPHIIKLYAFDNPGITTVNHMTKLQILNAGFNSGIDDNGIQNLNLVELWANNNPGITNVNHM